MRFLQEGSVEERVLMAMAAVQKFVARCHGVRHQRRLEYVHVRTIGRWKLKIEELLRAMPEEVTSDDETSVEQEITLWQWAIGERDLIVLDYLLRQMDSRWQGWVNAREVDRQYIIDVQMSVAQVVAADQSGSPDRAEWGRELIGRHPHNVEDF